MKTYDFTRRFRLTEEDILDVLCSCIEGGSNYWAQIQNEGEQWDEVENELPEDHTIEEHIMALWNKNYDLVILDIEEDETHYISFQRFLYAIQSVIDDGTWESADVYDIDGYIGDCIMQYATFGEVIYG